LSSEEVEEIDEAAPVDGIVATFNSVPTERPTRPWEGANAEVRDKDAAMVNAASACDLNVLMV